jgi:hypothetical protein
VLCRAVPSVSCPQLYVDQYLLADLPEGGRLAHAAIVGPDSGVWASDPTFPALSQAEAAKLAALLQTAAAVPAAAAAAPSGSSNRAGSNAKQQLVTETISIGGKVYEARVTPAAAAGGEGIPGSVLLVCRSKGGLMGLGGGKEGAVVAATGRALVMGLWDDRRAEAGCSSAVQRLAQALLSYGY